MSAASTIYAFSALGRSSSELAEVLLQRAHVATEAGSFYGSSGEGHLRICFGSESDERVDEAMDRIEAVVTDLAEEV